MFAFGQEQPDVAKPDSAAVQKDSSQSAQIDTTQSVQKDSAQPAPEISQEEKPADEAQKKRKTSNIRILEDRIKALEVYKIKDLEKRVKKLESPSSDTSPAPVVLTPLAKGDISTWGAGQGFGASLGSVCGNGSIGLELHILKIFLPEMERPMTHKGMLGFALGVDYWLNSGFTKNEKWGVSPYLKITGNSLVFENFLRIYASLEPCMVFGYALESQQQEDLHMGVRVAFGGEFFASRHYNLFAEVGLVKTESIDGTTDDTGLAPVIKLGPRFWF
jgi:hypothetical protein